MFGFAMQVTAEQAEPIRSLDPFFLQGTASANDVSLYTSRKFTLKYTWNFTTKERFQAR